MGCRPPDRGAVPGTVMSKSGSTSDAFSFSSSRLDSSSSVSWALAWFTALPISGRRLTSSRGSSFRRPVSAPCLPSSRPLTSCSSPSLRAARIFSCPSCSSCVSFSFIWLLLDRISFFGTKKALPPNHLGRKAYGFRGTTQLRGTEPRTRFPDNGGRPVRAFPRGSSRANTAAPDRPACSRRPVLSWAGFLRRTSRSKHFNTPFISYSAGTCKRKLQKNAKRADPPGPPIDCQKASQSSRPAGRE